MNRICISPLLFAGIFLALAGCGASSSGDSIVTDARGSANGSDGGSVQYPVSLGHLEAAGRPEKLF